MITVVVINNNDRIRLGIKYPTRGYANEFPSIDMSIIQLTRTNTRNRKQPKMKETTEFKLFIKHSPLNIGYFTPSQYKASIPFWNIFPSVGMMSVTRVCSSLIPIISRRV